MTSKTVNILGIRGIPARHGGFESFAAKLAPYLRDKGWTVNVYCQLDPEDGETGEDFEDSWEGINRIHLACRRTGSVGSIEFDWRATRDVLRRPGVDLVLGYNTAVFSLLQRLRGRRVAMNMDGIEWKRAKWSRPAKLWLYVNELIGNHSCSVPIADHPEIARHLDRHVHGRAIMIPYGSDVISDAPAAPVRALGIEPDRYLVSIARIEPENSILELVQGFSARPRGIKLVVLGNFAADNDYHQRVLAAGSDEVIFPGAIYDATVVEALRFHARAYLHGHQVGGTNPSLVEALGAGNAVLAHDNRFNRWVAGPDQFYFGDAPSLEQGLTQLIEDDARVRDARMGARERHEAQFRWDSVLSAYERLLAGMV